MIERRAPQVLICSYFVTDECSFLDTIQGESVGLLMGLASSTIPASSTLTATLSSVCFAGTRKARTSGAGGTA